MKTNAKIALLSLLLAYIELAEDSDFVVKNFESLQQKQQAEILSFSIPLNFSASSRSFKLYSKEFIPEISKGSFCPAFLIKIKGLEIAARYPIS
ncbi:hypothetical protein MVQ23_10710 [Fusobacterium necrophorum]|uniref:hypothetical protein n=1 Tax=Fusobacterium necrophorum TaxID=859 RepID=UPI00254EE067|nr:hypothetical protein [Fusobacterium necrophorum]MDK4486309.1 hypothetical protein [Fusobacterium necrophorum]